MLDHSNHVKLSAAERRLLDQSPETDRESRLHDLQKQLDLLTPTVHVGPNSAEALRHALVALDIAGLLLDLDRKNDAWDHARPTVEILVAHGEFESAALACQYVYLSDQFDAIPAIGQAAWLAVTYPVDPHLTANVLDHIIDETPDDSDGAAVAAATAHYVVDLRAQGPEQEELRMFTGANLARVAKRHSNVDSQQMFELWVERLELDVPEKFLVRMRNVIDVMVQFDWWFDRDELQEKLPE